MHPTSLYTWQSMTTMLVRTTISHYEKETISLSSAQRRETGGTLVTRKQKRKAMSLATISLNVMQSLEAEE